MQRQLKYTKLKVITSHSLTYSSETELLERKKQLDVVTEQPLKMNNESHMHHVQYNITLTFCCALWLHYSGLKTSVEQKQFKEDSFYSRVFKQILEWSSIHIFNKWVSKTRDRADSCHFYWQIHRNPLSLFFIVDIFWAICRVLPHFSNLMGLTQLAHL